MNELVEDLVAGKKRSCRLENKSIWSNNRSSELVTYHTLPSLWPRGTFCYPALPAAPFYTPLDQVGKGRVREPDGLLLAIHC